MKHILLLCISLISHSVIIPSDLDFKGFADSYYAFRIKGNNNYNALRSRIRGEVFSQFGDAYFFGSINAISNNSIKNNSGVNLHEMYMEYISQNWDLRIGRQIIIWGKADGLQITDIISPGDFTEFITRDFDDIRMPIDAVKFRYLSSITNVEVIWLPFFTSSILPSHGSPWALPSTGVQSDSKPLVSEPEKSLGNSEIAGKISFFLPGIDFAFSGFYTWDDMPILHKKNRNGKSSAELKYHRVSFLGFELNKPLTEFVIRTEIAFYKDKHFASSQTDDKTVKRNMLKKMLGLDWYPGNDWTISTQLANDMIIDYDQGITASKNNSLITLNVSKKILRQTLEISNMIYFGFDKKDIYEKFSVDYALTDEMHIACGADIFSGGEGKFGIYENNSQLWIKGKYNF